MFAPPTEKLAFAVTFEGEADLPEIWPEPLPEVIRVLTSCTDFQEVAENLPDIETIRSQKLTEDVTRAFMEKYRNNR